MKRKTCWGLIAMPLALLVVWACSESTTKPPAGGEVSLRSLQSECLAGSETSLGKVGEDPPQVTFTASHDTLWIDHDSALYNCGAVITFDLQRSGFELDVMEIADLDNPMHCMCYFDLQAELTGLAQGTYTVRLWLVGAGEPIAEGEVYVPGP